MNGSSGPQSSTRPLAPMSARFGSSVIHSTNCFRQNDAADDFDNRRTTSENRAGDSTKALTAESADVIASCRIQDLRV